MACRLHRKIAETRAWRDKHRHCERIEKHYLEAQPPSGYKLFELRCSCGAKHVDLEKLSESPPDGKSTP
jgi:hypothetical protein